jgi:hypothetical protein
MMSRTLANSGVMHKSRFLEPAARRALPGPASGRFDFGAKRRVSDCSQSGTRLGRPVETVCEPTRSARVRVVVRARSR